ncbi:GNAT family N-acetyltransferase [Actinosynnema sp. ALI-1.44]|uniref:GNAT family N-acetyltransferase n=1 Tax=Actinosynnema sp. ALI-1.44 TaxID=1933779 RepID=UPI00097BF837|nr:GNAT family N-acetyltransferase [Actinosynnema sp. ALI-1.44]ONI82843.1 GNAT family N-acetyltransferase [Actinosynnema sp. ALI-1.44]
MSIRLELVTPANVHAACDLKVLPEQEAVVAPVVLSLAEAYANRDTAWPRLVYDGEDLVGFVMAAFDPGNPVTAFRCGIWRLNIAADHQGKGYGRFAVDAVAAEARDRGADRITVLWVPHEHGPEEFYLRMGFRPTGEQIGGQVVGELRL